MGAISLTKKTISLTKGQKINLTKSADKLSEVVVGLGWDPVTSGGISMALFNPAIDIDCDAFCVVLDKDGKEKKTVYFGDKKGCNGSIRHTGDNLTGDGEGDDEQIIIKLKDIPSYAERILIAVNIYDGYKSKQHFGMIKNAFIRIYNTSEDHEMCRYNLSDKEYDGALTVTFGELYKDTNGEWQFKAIGEKDTAKDISEYSRRFR